MGSSIGDPRTLEEVGNRSEKKDGDIKDKLLFDNSIAAHIRWRKQYKTSC